MVFTSFSFLIFFLIVLILYYITPIKLKWITLLIVSYLFYINIKPSFALITAGVTLSTYIFTRLIDKTRVDSRKKRLMIINIILILLPLFFFKYFGALNNGILTLLENYNLRWPLPAIKPILPIGISFYTFMAIGYTIDVYNEDIESEKNIGILALFISFFPLILSGPIERAKNMLPQFKAIRQPDYNMVVQGVKFMLLGYFMKLVIADRVGIFIDSIYNDVSKSNGTSLLVASILYPFQVYADLGGYSLIAIGAARILGFNVMQNFKRPFFATSMSEFWRRWHISLITWLKDYLYTPLSFKYRKLGIWGIILALMITFLISGIWHGAALTFIVWGFLQGAFLSIEALTNKRRAIFEKKHNLSKRGWYILVGIFFTFILFTASQIFGRAANISDAIIVYNKIFTVSGHLFIEGYEHIIYGVSGIILLLIIEYKQEFFLQDSILFDDKHWVIEQMVYIFLIIMILLAGVLDGGQFIYFKF